jgi:two-component system LytT family response regulator
VSTSLVRAVIAEDEPLAREHLKDLLAPIGWVSVVGEVADGLSAIQLINSTRPELLFLDIHMPAADGLEVLRRLIYPPQVIFTTAFDRYAVAAFEVQALDYLLKPFGAKRLAQALERVRQPRSVSGPPTLERLAAARGDDTPLDRIYVQVGGRIIPLAVEKILHCEARGDYVALHALGRRRVCHPRLDRVPGRPSRSALLRAHSPVSDRESGRGGSIRAAR